MNKRPSQRDILVEMKRIQLEDEMQSTPQGRQSQQLRDRAIHAETLGEWAQAVELSRQAAALFEESDRSPSAAACWHTLAEMLVTPGAPGVRLYNLLEAEKYFLRAMASPSRDPKVDPYRAAISRDGLSKVYRDLAKISRGDKKLELLQKAIQISEKAVSIARDCGMDKWLQTSSCLLTLGNHHSACGPDHQKQAVKCYQEGLRLVAHMRSDPDLKEQLRTCAPNLEVLHRLNLARIQVLSENEADRLGARSLFRELIRSELRQYADEARMELARLLLSDPNDAARSEAQTLLKSVVNSSWRHSNRNLLAELLQASGLLAEAHKVLFEKLTSLLEEWHSTGTSEYGAHVQIELSKTSRQIADVYVEQGRPLEAFLRIENVAALTFYESLRYLVPLPADPVARGLFWARGGLNAVAAHIERKIAYLSHIPEEHHQEVLGESLDGLQKLDPAQDLQIEQLRQSGDLPEHHFYVRQRMIDMLASAFASKAPVGTLRQSRKALEDEIDRLDQQIHERDPAFHALNQYVALDITKSHLEHLFEQWPDILLLRVYLSSDLLTISVWAENGEVKSRAHRQEITPELADAIQEIMHTRGSQGAALASARLSSSVAAIDLTAALPENRPARVMVLPSNFAAWMPLNALGAPGKTLLDLFESVHWLPNLSPLVLPQRPTRPRTGRVMVLPPGTHNAQLARLHPMPDEVRLEGAAARLAPVLEQARGAEVLSFFTHHAHGIETPGEAEEGEAPPALPGLSLAEGDRFTEKNALPSMFFGMERVELWACESGVDVPNQPLIPPHDDAFGLDAHFLKQGVRTAIGTLWKVPDFVTACLVSHYRQRLEQGVNAARALADAQRWWRDEGVQTLRSYLEQLPIDAALAQFSGTLGVHPTGADASKLEHSLGAAPAQGPLIGPELEALMATLSSPLAWAGFRFLGITGIRSDESWSEELEHPLTTEERSEVDSILAWAQNPGDGATPPPFHALPNSAGGTTDAEEEPTLREPYGEAQEKWLKEAQALLTEGSPTPTLALGVARLYRYRLNSSHRHNLLAGLAWLHEALAVPDILPQARNQLRLDAAWLWLDLAVNEAHHPLMLTLRPCQPGLVARVRQLLKDLPANFEVEVARTWCAVLEVSYRSPEALATHAERARVNLEPLLNAWIKGSPKPDLRDATGLIWALDLLRACKRLTASDFRPWLEAANALLCRVPAWEEMGLATRLMLMAWLVNNTHKCGVPIRAQDKRYLTARDHTALALFMQTIGQGVPERSHWYMQQMSDCFIALEDAYWGQPSGSPMPLWRSTGNPGAAWRTMTSALLLTRGTEAGYEDSVPGALGQLQLGADLHLALMSRVSRMAAMKGSREAKYLARMLRIREQLFELLLEIGANLRAGESTPHPKLGRPFLDAFACSVSELPIERFEDNLSPFLLWQFTRSWPAPDHTPQPRTTAFLAVRICERVSPTLSEKGENLSPDAPDRAEIPPEIAIKREQFSDFGTQSADLERELVALPPGQGVIGLTFGPLGQLIGMVQWNSGEGSKGRMHVSPEAGRYLKQHLLELMTPNMLDESLRRGSATIRGNAWLELQKGMDDFLRKLLGKRAHHPIAWRVFAPGALRSLPWLGLTNKNVPLFQYSTAVTHLPAFRFDGGVPILSSRTTACLLAPHHESGTTSFGEAVVTTLRRWFPPEVVLDPTRFSGSEVVEVHPLERCGPTIGRVRFYAVGGLQATSDGTAELLLAGGRTFTQLETGGLYLGRCDGVELWDETASIGPISRLMSDDSDRIPGLAHAFFQAGAQSVLDLAWPIHDIVRALICERYTVLRERGGLSGARALTQAVREWSALLRRLQTEGSQFSHVEQVLVWLDKERSVLARTAGLDPSCMVGLNTMRSAPSLNGLDAAAVVQDICHPVHLAAFRWWGST